MPTELTPEQRVRLEEMREHLNTRDGVALETLLTSYDAQSELVEHMNETAEALSMQLRAANVECDARGERIEALEAERDEALAGCKQLASQLSHMTDLAQSILSTEPQGEFVIHMAYRDDGGLRVWSDTHPGLILSGEDPDKVAACIWPALTALTKHKKGAPSDPPVPLPPVTAEDVIFHGAPDKEGADRTGTGDSWTVEPAADFAHLMNEGHNDNGPRLDEINVAESVYEAGRWVVEVIEAEDGAVQQSEFFGYCAEERARAYAKSLVPLPADIAALVEEARAFVAGRPGAFSNSIIDRLASALERSQPARRVDGPSDQG